MNETGCRWWQNVGESKMAFRDESFRQGFTPTREEYVIFHQMSNIFKYSGPF